MLETTKYTAEEVVRLAEEYKTEAEALHRSGKYHCAESTLSTLCKHFRPDLPEEIAQLASGFGGGSGSGCLCGAVAGGTIALGLILKEDKKQIQKLTAELHGWFKEKFGTTCCRSIRSRHEKAFCPVITGDVTGKVTELLLK